MTDSEIKSHKNTESPLEVFEGLSGLIDGSTSITAKGDISLMLISKSHR